MTILHHSSSLYLPVSFSRRIIITSTFFLFFFGYIKSHPRPFLLLSFCPQVPQKETSISCPPSATPRLLLLFYPFLSLSFRLILSSILPITSTIPIVVNLSETFGKLAVIAGKWARLQWAEAGGGGIKKDWGKRFQGKEVEGLWWRRYRNEVGVGSGGERGLGSEGEAGGELKRGWGLQWGKLNKLV